LRGGNIVEILKKITVKKKVVVFSQGDTYIVRCTFSQNLKGRTAPFGCGKQIFITKRDQL